MLISRIVVIINKDNRKYLYLIVRDRILEFIKYKLLQKYLLRIFLLIREQNLKNRKQLNIVIVLITNYIN